MLPAVAAECADHAVWQGRSPVRSVSMWEEVPRSPGRIRWETWITAHSSWIGLRIDGEAPGEAEHYYQGLLDQRSEIEEAFGAELQWKRLDKAEASLLRWDNSVSGGHRDSAIGWRDAAESLAEHMRRLVEATKSRVQELDPYGTGDGVAVAEVEVYTDGAGDIAKVIHP